MSDWDPNDPRTKRAAEALKNIVVRIVGPKPGLPRRRAVTQHTIDALYDAIAAHKQLVKNRYGINFPDMTVLYLPSVDEFRLHPRELPRGNIERIAINLKIEFQGALPINELARAVHAAWPSFKPTGPVIDRATTH